VFSEAQPQAKNLVEIMQIAGKDISYCSKEVEDFRIFNREAQKFLKGLVRSESCSQGNKEHLELLAERQRITMTNNDRKLLYRRLYCEIIDTMK
jgi:hypothetical protein